MYLSICLSDWHRFFLQGQLLEFFWYERRDEKLTVYTADMRKTIPAVFLCLPQLLYRCYELSLQKSMAESKGLR